MGERMTAELAEELVSPERRLVDPRSLPVRFSRLKHIARSPAHYFAACQGLVDDTPAKKAGRAAHAAALGTPLVEWDKKTAAGATAPRRGKEWEAFKAANKGAEIVTPAEAEPARAIAAAVRKHERAAELIFSDGVQREHELAWSYMGRRWESHLDIYRRGAWLFDLKCLKDGNPERVRRLALWEHYHVQLATYALAAEQLGHPPPKLCGLIVVENSPPYAVTVMPLSERALAAGRKVLHGWCEKLKACESANAWPAYSQVDEEIDVPEDERITLTFGGEPLEL